MYVWWKMGSGDLEIEAFWGSTFGLELCTFVGGVYEKLFFE